MFPRRPRPCTGWPEVSRSPHHNVAGVEEDERRLRCRVWLSHRPDEVPEGVGALVGGLGAEGGTRTNWTCYASSGIQQQAAGFGGAGAADQVIAVPAGAETKRQCGLAGREPTAGG